MRLSNRFYWVTGLTHAYLFSVNTGFIVVNVETVKMWMSIHIIKVGCWNEKIYLVLFMLAIGLFVVIYGSREEYDPPITYDETKTPFQNKLMKYSYEANNSIGNTISMYIITGTEENLNFDKIMVSEWNDITLNIKKDEPFIISLPANRTVAAKWIFKSDDSTSNNLILEKEEWLNTFKIIPKNSTGVSYARQFFYFKAISIKNIMLKFEYTPNEKQKDDSENCYFKFKINVV